MPVEAAPMSRRKMLVFSIGYDADGPARGRKVLRLDISNAIPQEILRVLRVRFCSPDTLLEAQSRIERLTHRMINLTSPTLRPIRLEMWAGFPVVVLTPLYSNGTLS